MSAAIPGNESDRLAALWELDILDTAPEETFDRITRLAAALIGAPIVLVSFVDRDRQWFKSRVGLDATQTPREHAFCAHAVLGDEIFVVSDATQDPRFSGNPLVVGEPEIRFYAGAPLTVSEGVRLGALCVIDKVPRTLTTQQRATLRDLAAVVVDELALRARVMELRSARAALMRQARELRLANEALSQFAHMAAHDLRGPLKTIINMADIALLSGESPPVTFIREVSRQLEEMVSGYQRLSQLRLGVCTPVSVGALLGDAGSELPVRLCGAACTVYGDRPLLRQLFVNLVQNAARYGSGALAVSAGDNGAWVEIQVQNPVEADVHVDQGVFAPFRRLHEDRCGTGLGLAIVERIVQLHGGRVGASCADRVFTISLRLPRTPEAVPC